MAVTSGFFNSVNHDRLYNAEQISSMFDGIILDGIYQGLGDAFIVKPYSELNCTVTVGTGRAWFDHTWTLNSTELALTLDDPNVLYDRIDAIVIDVDRRQDVRANSIKVVKGTVSETGATKPTLIEEELHNQYPLAYVTVKAGSAAPIQAQYIENVIGQTKTPLVAGVLEHMDIGMFVQQMEDEFNTWFDRLKDTIDENTVADINNKLLELQDFDTSIKDSIINPEGYAASKKGSLSVVDLGGFSSARGLCSYSAMLSDGYIMKLTAKRSSKAYSQNTYEEYYWQIPTVSIYNTEGVRVGSFDGVESVSASVGSSPTSTSYFPTIGLVSSTEAYPHVFQFAVGTSMIHTFTSGMSVPIDVIPGCLTITVTSDHNVTITMAHYGNQNNYGCGTIDRYQNQISSDSNDRPVDYQYGLAGSQNVAKLSNGSYMALLGATDDDNYRILVRPYIISSDGIITSAAAKNGTINESSGAYNRSKDQDDYAPDGAFLFCLYQSNKDTGSVGASAATYGRFSNNESSAGTAPELHYLKINLTDLSISAASSYSYKDKDIYIDNIYYAIDANGEYLFKQENSLTAYEKLMDVPEFIDFSTNLKGAQGIAEYTGGLCSEDKKIIVSGNGNEMRVGFAGDGTGFMSFTPMFSGSALSSTAKAQSLKLIKKIPQWKNGSGTQYNFLVPGYISTRKGFPQFPGNAENRRRTVNHSYLIIVRTGE